MRSLREKIIYKPAFFMMLSVVAAIMLSYFLFSSKLIFLFKLFFIIEFILLFYYLFYYFKTEKASVFILITIILFITASFLYAYEEHKYQSKYSLNKFSVVKKAEIIARIDFDLGDLESGKIYLKPVRVNNQKIKYGKILSYSEKLSSFNDGDLIFLKLNLTKPESALNPGAFSFAKYLKKDGIYLQGWEAENIKLINSKKSFKNIIISLKRKLLKNINLLFKNKDAAFIKAILLGEKEYLSYEQESLLRNSGASHLLAISGLHMGIIILTFSFILFKIFSKKRTALYFLSFLTLIYIIIVGAAVSIIRASLLALLFLWADEFNREGNFLNIISFTLIINLLLNPLALFTVSLQLSYLLVFALFYLSPLLNRLFLPFLSVSLAAQLGAFAISAYYFNEYSWIALITNLWLIPFISILLPFIFIVVLLSLFFFKFLFPFIFLIEFSLKLLFTALKLMTDVQGLPFVIASPDSIIIFSYYLFLFSLPIIYQKRYLTVRAKKFFIWQKIIPLLLFLILISFFINFDSGLLEVNYLAVGQGDGAFIKFPNGENMIVDTGPPGKEGRNVEYNLISFLNYNGIKKIDYLMISHFDADHVGGLAHLLKRKKIKNILIPPFKEKTYFHKQLEKELLQNQELNIIYLREKMFFKVAGCGIKILNPQADYLADDRNQNSITFLLDYKNKSFLFTGDLSKKGENRIISEHQLGKIDVLKVGHHGSNTSTGEKLLSSTLPALAVISVGRNNFGHPAAAVLNRLEKYKINYLRTDKNGLIKVLSDGENIWFNSFKELESSN